jgi:hypothetical protein
MIPGTLPLDSVLAARGPLSALVRREPDVLVAVGVSLLSGRHDVVGPCMIWARLVTAATRAR